MGSAADWLFRNRQTGETTIAQFPNPPLWIWLGASVTRWVFDPSGTAGSLLAVIATGAAVWWGADELIRGVNPWRRALGAGVLVWQLLRLVT